MCRNRSGVVGVFWRKREKIWQVDIIRDGLRIQKSFKDFDSAVAYRQHCLDNFEQAYVERQREIVKKKPSKKVIRGIKQVSELSDTSWLDVPHHLQATYRSIQLEIAAMQ